MATAASQRPEAHPVTPEPIMKIASGVMAAKHLFAASELGIFEALAGSPADVDALADFWTDPTHTEPLHAALMAGEFAVHMRHGDVYSVEEVRGWLAETGWRFDRHAGLAGPQSVVVAEAG
ncbi:MAG: methyltransferase family protein [Acidimicrobiales bacterium]